MGKCLPGIMRTEDIPLPLHTAQGTYVSCTLPNPEGSRLPSTSYSAPYSTSLAYEYELPVSVTSCLTYNN